nr:J418 [uncultured bacterium]
MLARATKPVPASSLARAVVLPPVPVVLTQPLPPVPQSQPSAP